MIIQSNIISYAARIQQLIQHRKISANRIIFDNAA